MSQCKTVSCGWMTAVFAIKKCFLLIMFLSLSFSCTSIKQHPCGSVGMPGFGWGYEIDEYGISTYWGPNNIHCATIDIQQKAKKYHPEWFDSSIIDPKITKFESDFTNFKNDVIKIRSKLDKFEKKLDAAKILSIPPLSQKYLIEWQIDVVESSKLSLKKYVNSSDLKVNINMLKVNSKLDEIQKNWTKLLLILEQRVKHEETGVSNTNLIVAETIRKNQTITAVLDVFENELN